MKLTKQEEDEVLCMLYKIMQICFNESDYVAPYSIMNIITKNETKLMYEMPQ